MIHLHEYQAKNLFARHNLPVLPGKICSNINDVENYIKNNAGPWAAKCQIQAGGRGKSNGICITHSTEKILFFSKKWFGNQLKTYQTADSGELVNHILIEPAVKISQELYISILIDTDFYQIICMASAQGGIDIENIHKNTPDSIHKITIDPAMGAHFYQGRILANKLGLYGDKVNQFSNIIVNLSQMLLTRDLMLVEINPLVITNNNTLLCLDAKVTLDQNAMFRQSELWKICLTDCHDQRVNNTMQSHKSQLGINYIPLFNGNIGCMVNGAGLAMATMDLIQEFGGIPANFLDIGGDCTKDSIVSALHMLLKNKKLKVVLINIFGGIVCCNLIADSIISVLSSVTNNSTQHIPIIVRLQGNNAKSGLKKLINNTFNIIITDNLIDAIQKIVTMVK